MRATYFRESRPHSAVEAARKLEVRALLDEILNHVVSDDIEADLEKVESVGGTVVLHETERPRIGR